MHNIIAIISVVGCGIALPIFSIWSGIRSEMNKENNRKEILLKALEKNPDVDIEDLMRKLNPPKQLIKEKLLRKLLWGMMLFFAGIGLIIAAVIIGYREGWGSDPIYFTGICGAICFAIGMGLLANYHIGKKMLADEMEAERKNLEKQ